MVLCLFLAYSRLAPFCRWPCSFNEERPVSTPTATINSDAGDGKFSTAGFDLTRWTKNQIDERCWISPRQIRISGFRHRTTFLSTLLDNKKDGIYCCVVCRLPLFESTNKFTSGTGGLRSTASSRTSLKSKTVPTAWCVLRFAASAATRWDVFPDGPHLRGGGIASTAKP